MKIILQSRNIEVDETLSKFMEQQLSELDRHNFRLVKLTVVLERVEKKKNDSFANQVTLIADWPGENIVVERHAEDLKVAFVDAVERLDHALLKAKEKRRDELRKA
jgi:ribosomal subunit interface protein